MNWILQSNYAFEYLMRNDFLLFFNIAISQSIKEIENLSFSHLIQMNLTTMLKFVLFAMFLIGNTSGKYLDSIH